MKFTAKKYLFYYCDVNWCYCVECASINLSIYRMDKLRIQIESGVRHYFTLMEIQTVAYCTQVYRWVVSVGIF